MRHLFRALGYPDLRMHCIHCILYIIVECIIIAFRRTRRRL